MELKDVNRNTDISIGVEEWSKGEHKCLIQHYSPEGQAGADYFFSTTEEQREDTYEFIIWKSDSVVADGYPYDGLEKVYKAAYESWKGLVM